MMFLGLLLLAVAVLTRCVSLPLSTSTSPLVTTVCESFNRYDCPSECNMTTTVCTLVAPIYRAQCFVLWNIDAMGHLTILRKDCTSDNMDCYDQHQCVEMENHRGKNGDAYCCCEGNMCNADFHPLSFGGKNSTDVFDTKIPARLVSTSSGDQHTFTKNIIYTVLPLTTFAVCFVVAFWIWRHFYIANQMSQLPSDDLLSPLAHKPDGLAVLGQLHLLEIKAQGRFGCVWKATTCKGRLVAVKVFPSQDCKSWSAEKDFYNLECVGTHENLLRFLGSDCRSGEWWIVTEYHDHGSLYDYLKSNAVSITEAVRIASTMCKGLAFLHSAQGEKPSIAHRDIKSRNVILRSDFSVCIGDFGLALVLGDHLNEIPAQVGTRRYMAPEVLDGSINFTIEHVLKIDVYACALTLWEVLSRCQMPEGSPIDYLMPFEEEVGKRPTLEDMQNLVVTLRKRPCLKKTWYNNEVTANMCVIVEESWDHDPEARLSAECIEQRLAMLQ